MYVEKRLAHYIDSTSQCGWCSSC